MTAPMFDPAGEPRRDLEPAPVDYREGTITEAFNAFHTAHPEVLDALVKLTVQARNAGRSRVGMKQLFEVLRWNRMIAGLPDEGEAFKLNNNYTSRYARLVGDLHPELAAMFRLRELKTA